MNMLVSFSFNGYGGNSYIAKGIYVDNTTMLITRADGESLATCIESAAATASSIAPYTELLVLENNQATRWTNPWVPQNQGIPEWEPVVMTRALQEHVAHVNKLVNNQ